jgi:hypothetical protein
MKCPVDRFYADFQTKLDHWMNGFIEDTTPVQYDIHHYGRNSLPIKALLQQSTYFRALIDL